MLEYYIFPKATRAPKTDTRIVVDLIHVKFDDNLGFENSKLVEDLVDLKDIISDSEGKESKERDF